MQQGMQAKSSHPGEAAETHERPLLSCTASTYTRGHVNTCVVRVRTREQGQTNDLLYNSQRVRVWCIT